MSSQATEQKATSVFDVVNGWHFGVLAAGIALLSLGLYIPA